MYGLTLRDITGDTVWPGLEVDELLAYVRHYEQHQAAAAQPVAGEGGGGVRARRKRHGRS